MSSTAWDEMTRRWRERYDQQAVLARSWLGQTPPAETAAARWGADAAEDAAAMAELWRSWLALGAEPARVLCVTRS